MASTVVYRENSRDKAAGTGQPDRTAGTGQPGQDSRGWNRIDQLVHDSQDRIAEDGRRRAVWPEHARKNKAVWRGHQG